MRKPLLLLLLLATSLVVLFAAIYLRRGGIHERDTTNLKGGGVHVRDAKLDAKDKKFFYNNGNRPNIDEFVRLLTQLRARLASGETSHGIQRLARAADVSLEERFIEVELQNGDVGNVITVVIDTVNVYVVGYYETRTAIGSKPTLHYLLFDDPLVERDFFLAYPTKDYTRKSLCFSGSYTLLPERDTVEIGHGALNDAIRNLYDGEQNTKNEIRKLKIAMVVIIQMVAEAVRIRYVECRIRIFMRDEVNSIPDKMLTSVENQWAKLSRQIQWSDAKGAFRENIPVNDVFNNIVQIANVAKVMRNIGVVLLLYIAACNPRGNTGIPVLGGAEDHEPCPYGDTTTNIIGRDALCMDVYNSEYHDGNSVILWECGYAQPNQLWTFKSWDRTIRCNDKCLTTYGYAPGSYLMIYDCDKATYRSTQWDLSDDGTLMNPTSGLVITAESSTQGGTLKVAKDDDSASQAWSAGNYTHPTISYITGHSEMCLQANGINARVWLEECVFYIEPMQQWALYDDRTIRLYSDRTVCVTSDGNKSGDNIFLRKCQGSENQRWTFMADGTILNPNARLVMDVRGSDVSAQVIILYRPKGRPNQIWMAI